MAHGFGIDGKRLGFVRLAIIDIGECGAIYQDIEIEGFEGLRKQIGLGEIQLMAVKANDLMPRGPGLDKGCSESSGSSGNNNAGHKFFVVMFKKMLLSF